MDLPVPFKILSIVTALPRCAEEDVEAGRESWCPDANGRPTALMLL